MMATSNEGLHDTNSDEIKEKMKEFQRKLTEKKAMNQLKEAFDKLMKTSGKHQQNIEFLQRTINATSERKSYEEMFRELGGLEFQNALVTDDLENILEELVKTDKVMPIEDEKEKLFKEWDKLLNII